MRCSQNREQSWTSRSHFETKSWKIWCLLSTSTVRADWKHNTVQWMPGKQLFNFKLMDCSCTLVGNLVSELAVLLHLLTKFAILWPTYAMLSLLLLSLITASVLSSHLLGCSPEGKVMIIRPHRSIMYVVAVYCYRWSSVVCWPVMIMSPAQTAEPIDMPFGLWTR